MKPRIICFVWLLISALSVSAQPVDSVEDLLIDPDPNPPDLESFTIQTTRSKDTLNIRWRGQGILQENHSLDPEGWRNIALARRHIVDLDEAARFYRVITVSRPVRVHVPKSYVESVPLPLVVYLHGHGGTGEEDQPYFRFRDLSESVGYLYCYPDGTQEDSDNRFRFWNASKGCCNFYGSSVDDAAYLRRLIEEIQSLVNVDPKRICLYGVSNGAFMAHRMAAEHSDLISAIAAQAGTMSRDDPFDPEHPVNILQIHGTHDEIIGYGGGKIDEWWGVAESAFMGVTETLQRWAEANGASDFELSATETHDLMSSKGTPEDTFVGVYENHPEGGAIELWKLQAGEHWDDPTDEFSDMAIDWLLSTLSRDKFIFGTLPDTRRRKPLTKKLLGLN